MTFELVVNNSLGRLRPFSGFLIAIFFISIFKSFVLIMSCKPCPTTPKPNKPIVNLPTKLLNVIDNTETIDNILYIVSTTRYENNIPKIDTDVALMLDQEIIYAYPDKWMALVTASKILSKNEITLEIDTITEKYKGALNLLKVCGYIYVVDRYNFKKKGLRYKNNGNIDIIKREYISDFLEELKKCKIQIIRYK